MAIMNLSRPEIFEAVDFALVTKWPDLKPGTNEENADIRCERVCAAWRMMHKTGER